MRFILLYCICFFLSINLGYTDDRRKLLESFTPPKPVIYTLENGLKLVIDVDPRADVVKHMIWYKVGSADEKSGESGIAHFLEHLLFRGTKQHPPGYFSKRISEIGGTDNAFTTYDVTAYYQEIPAQHITEVMALEADRMRNLQLTEDEIARERNVVLEERALRIDTKPTLQLLEQMRTSLYRNHPYGSPVIGWQHEISALNKKQIMAFYQKYYAPNNAIVTIVGNVKPDEIFSQAQETYGKIPSVVDVTPSERAKEPPQNVQRIVKLAHKNVKAEKLYLMLEGVSPLKEPEKFYALYLFMNHIAHGPNSILYKKLVKEQKIALDIGVHLSGERKDTAPIIFYLSPGENISLEDLKQAFEKELVTVLKAGLSEKDLMREQNEVLAGFINGFDSRDFRSQLWGALAYGNSLKDIQNFPKMMTKISTKDSETITKQLFQPTHQVWGFLEVKK